MCKVHLSIDNQINHLKNCKNIYDIDEKSAHIYLTNNNYYNFVNPTKYHFIVNYSAQKYSYKSSSFSDWICVDQEFKKLELNILKLILEKERIIKSHLIEYIYQEYSNYSEAKIVKKFVELVCFRNKNSFNEKGYILNGIILEKCSMMICEAIYIYINHLTMRDLCEILKVTSKQFRRNLSLEISVNLNKKDNIEFLRELRNRMAHNIPLIYYFLDKKNSITAVGDRYNLLIDLCGCNSLIDELYKIAKNQIRISKNMKISN